MPRPCRALRAFADYLAHNRDRFAVSVRLGRRTDEVWRFGFDGVTPAITGWISTREVTVSVEVDGECWDHIFDRDVGTRAVLGGFVCPYCLDEPPKVFPDREALWVDHLFEPLLGWVNGTLAPAVWLELCGDAESLTTARLVGHSPARSGKTSRETIRSSP